MKLLFDENVSYRVVKKIAHLFPDCENVGRVKLLNTNDLLIWEYAQKNDFAIVTFDEDFGELSLLKGYPPKVILLKTGNISKNDLIELFIDKQEVIFSFLENEEFGCLELYK
jgi:predicted nuclease of predicted toxin-antitoxin system